MSRLQSLLECVGHSILKYGVPPRGGNVFPGDAHLDIVRSSLEHFSKRSTDLDRRSALREAVSAPQDTVDLALSDALADLPMPVGADLAAFSEYLELFPTSCRQALRRPGDPIGTSVPDHLPLDRVEDWLLFFPDRLVRFKSGETLEAFDNWRLIDLRGIGNFGEVWQGLMPEQSANTVGSLKFITDPGAAADFAQHEDLFRRILELEPMSGLVHLRSVYLLGDPPCLESAYVSGYDAASLINDWRWRGEKTRPEQVALIVKRVAKIVGRLHHLDPPIVHRGLKLSNILLHPTAGGKSTVWVSDLGWGEICSAISSARAEGAQADRQSRRGANAALYASPQQKAGRLPDPRDDVYALGAIWHQLLVRDPAANPPEGHEWAMQFRSAGLSDGHARLLASCLEENPDHRPADGLLLAAQIDANFGKITGNGSGTFRLRDSSATMKPLATDQVATGNPRTPTNPPLIVDLPKSFQNAIGMEFVLLPVGSFVMGSPQEEKGRHVSEGPAHLVQITRPFYLGIAPVTQAQFQQLMSRNSSYFSVTRGGGPDHPVEQITWEDAVAFCQKLMQLREEAAQCRIYRLPTEAEWEYACRAGTTTRYAVGDDIDREHAHFFGFDASSSPRIISKAGKTEKIASHAANAWGLYDMHGNVLEWCQDWWSETYYAESPEADPTGPREGLERVARGGSFSQFVADCRSASRLGQAPSGRLNTVGFRVAMSIPGT